MLVTVQDDNIRWAQLKANNTPVLFRPIMVPFSKWSVNTVNSNGNGLVDCFSSL